MFQNFVNTLRFMSFDKLKTDVHPIVDLILTTVGMYVVGKFVMYVENYNISDVWKYVCNFFDDDIYYIKLCGKFTTNPSPWGELNVNSAVSERFIASVEFIMKRLENLEVNDLKEFYSNKHSEEDDINAFNNMIVNQNSKFHLINNIFCKFRLLNETNEDDKKKYNIQTIEIQLSSKTRTCEEIMNFVNEITTAYQQAKQKKRKNAKFVYTVIVPNKKEESSSKFDRWVEQVFSSNSSFDTLFFEKKELILSKINFFINNENWYKEMGIPYHLGIGLHGLPGTGKTSFIKALANQLKRSLIVLPLKLITTKTELLELYHENTYNKENEVGSVSWDKKIIVFEDIDCIGDIVKNRSTKKEKTNEAPLFDIQMDGQLALAQAINKMSSSDNVNASSNVNSMPFLTPDKLTLDDFLNLWDGLFETPGRIIILTSNHYDELDPALVRPGRIDIAHQFQNVSRPILQEFHQKYFGKEMSKETLESIPEYHFSPAEITNFFQYSNFNEESYIKLLRSKNI